MLIVSADRRELAPLAKRLAARRRLDWPIAWAVAGRLGAREVLLAAGGAGRGQAASAVAGAARRFALSGVVSAGWCGALDPALSIAQVVVADRVVAEDNGWAFPALAVPGPAARGTILTSDHFVATAEEKRRLHQTGAIAVEMEAAGVAAEAQRLGLPFYCVRSVSDSAETTIRLNGHRLPTGDLTAARIARRAGLFPWRWIDLFRLWRGAAAAAESLADFLEDRFAC